MIRRVRSTSLKAVRPFAFAKMRNAKPWGRGHSGLRPSSTSARQGHQDAEAAVVSGLEYFSYSAEQRGCIAESVADVRGIDDTQLIPRSGGPSPRSLIEVAVSSLVR